MKKYGIILFICILSLFVFSFVHYTRYYDGKLHIIVCDVGQGDGILIKTPSNQLLMYDSGPDESILSCLSDNVPFWKKTIDVFILSHPHSDHFMGMFSVLSHFTVKSYISETLVNRSFSFEELQKQTQTKGIPVKNLKKGDVLRLSEEVVLRVLGPSDTFLKRTSPQGEIGESGEFASLIIRIEYQDFSMLLTGDSQVSGLLDANSSLVTVLHVPHHGSKTGLNKEILQKLNPEIAVISVGKNKYGHPSPEILKIIGEKDITVLRTDEHGDIKIITDGKHHTVITQRN